jgi:tetratricopeptide (TPR) repeat protein
MIPQGPLPTVRLNTTYIGKPEDRVPLCRFLEPWEDGLEEHLSKMSPEDATDLRSLYAMARCALEEGQWETASSSLLRCGEILEREKTRVGDLSYGLLLLWAEYPLANMYQLRGSAEGSTQMLEKAEEIWFEILNATQFPAIWSFWCTAQYEVGCASGHSEMKAVAVEAYAELIQREFFFAERELCLLLSYDYYWSGAFETSLKWIQKANRLYDCAAQPPAYLRWEVYVLMKLHRFEDALSALDNLSFPQVSESDAVGSAREKEIRCWIIDCFVQMHKSSISDGDPQELNNNEELKELQLALEYSLDLGYVTYI